MKDLDFDELDRAVSSLLGGADQPTKEQTDTNFISEQPKAAPEASKNFVQKRQGGRFMDIMPATSEAKKAIKPPISRTGNTIIAPEVSKPEVDENNQTKTISPELESSSLNSAANLAPQNLQTDSVSDESVVSEDVLQMPDPLDFHGFDQAKDKAQSDDREEAASQNIQEQKVDLPNPEAAFIEEKTEVDQLVDENGQPAETSDDLERVSSELAQLDGLVGDSQNESLQSPFVIGSQPTKRPLGAFSSDQLESGQEIEDNQNLQSNKITDELKIDSQASVNQETDKEPADQNQEEQNAISNLESSSDAQIDLSEQNTEKVDADEQSSGKNKVEAIAPELKPDLVSIESSEVRAVSPSGATSILQQYTEKTTKTKPVSTPVFDTENYHQPLKHAPKKKSGWAIVLIILTLVLLGAAAGAFFYFFDPLGLF